MKSHNSEKKQIANDALNAIQYIYEAALETKERRAHSSFKSYDLYYPLEITLKQPIFASVSVLDATEQKKTIYFTKGETFQGTDCIVANYRAPLGRLAALNIGDYEYIQLPRKKEEEYELLQKNEFSPFKQNNIWDSEATMYFSDRAFQEKSLRELINLCDDIEDVIVKPTKIKDGDTTLLHEVKLSDDKPDITHKTQGNSIVSEQPQKLKKEIIHSMSLRDKPILDKIQDTIFRLSPRAQIVLMGPPGTGKTTTLIKKLGLNLDDQYSEIRDDKSWYMFTPTDLLKVYLKEAFAREGIAAPDRNVFTWKNFIRTIARDILNILKTPTGKGGNLILVENEQLLKNDSKFQQNIYNQFFQWMNNDYANANVSIINDAINKITVKLSNLNDRNSVKFIQDSIKKIRINNDTRIITLLQSIAELKNDFGDKANILINKVHFGNDDNKHKDEIEKFIQIKNIVDSIEKDINANLYFSNIKEKYKIFRNTHPQFYTPNTPDNTISLSELDIIVLAYLTVYNEFTKRNMFNTKLKIYKDIRNIQRTQVFVDEITDFSAVQLKIMSQLFSNDYKTFVGAGDFNQRITDSGISTEEELRWAIPSISIHNIRIPYRQSKQLYEFSQKLIDCYDNNFEQPKYLDIEGLYPTVGYKIDSLDKKAKWLTERICEIERQIEDKLPSIAILVNEESEIEPLAECLNEYLQEYNIQVDPCLRGQVLGYENNIRIFSIDYIKGLEFEAAFFMDVDEFAKKRPSNFNRFLYVGTSRAATYLGLTISGASLPKKLSRVENLLLEKWEI